MDDLLTPGQGYLKERDTEPKFWELQSQLPCREAQTFLHWDPFPLAKQTANTASQLLIFFIMNQNKYTNSEVNCTNVYGTSQNTVHNMDIIL